MQLFAELKRRNVFRVAVAYLVSAWLVIQVVETIFPPFGFGDAAIRAVVVTLGIGLIPVLVISWVFELTPEGLKLDKDVDRANSVTRHTGRKLDRAILGVLAMAVAYFAVDKFVLDPARDAEQLHVSYVLDGSVRKAGDQVRISAQLIDAQSDTQLWSRNFDRTLQNIFQIQDEIAGDVVDQIKGTLNISLPE